MSMLAFGSPLNEVCLVPDLCCAWSGLRWPASASVADECDSLSHV